MQPARDAIPDIRLTTFLERLAAREGDLVRALEYLVRVESPSNDLSATSDCAEAVGEIGTDLLGVPPERISVEGHPHLLWSSATPRVLLLGHLDTVWPHGTLSRWPFSVVDGRATGPGVFDMKAGLVQGLFALSVLEELDGIAVLVTSDEEIGSPTSRSLIEETARGLEAVLVLEPSQDGALKTGRKGGSFYEVEVRGRASHAGLEPERGVNALVELAHQVLSTASMTNSNLGTTVTPTVAQSGTATNVVPAEATLELDVRTATVAEQERVHRDINRLRGAVAGTKLTVRGGPNRPPLEPAAAKALFGRARRIADEIGLGRLDAITVGGGSDGNFTGGIGVPTLDGLGAVGDGAHAEGEYVEVATMPPRAALVAALVQDLLQRPLSL